MDLLLLPGLIQIKLPNDTISSPRPSQQHPVCSPLSDIPPLWFSLLASLLHTLGWCGLHLTNLMTPCPPCPHVISQASAASQQRSNGCQMMCHHFSPAVNIINLNFLTLWNNLKSNSLFLCKLNDLELNCASHLLDYTITFEQRERKKIELNLQRFSSICIFGIK